jgi:hypothetical protein
MVRRQVWWVCGRCGGLCVCDERVGLLGWVSVGLGTISHIFENCV